jgi:hypothetical protein
MGFAIFFFLTWLICAVFFVIKKQLCIIENTAVFLIILILNINFAWIVNEELKYIIITKSGIDYIPFLLNRSILLPMILLVYLNLMLRIDKSSYRTIYLTVSSVGLMLGLSFLTTSLRIAEYTTWTHGYDLIFYLFLHFMAFYTYKLFRQFSNKVVHSP